MFDWPRGSLHVCNVTCMVNGNSKYAPLLRNVEKLKPGEAFIATQNDDFTCDPATFAGVVYKLAAAKSGGWKGTVAVIGRSVVYAFYRRDDYMRPNLSAYPIVRKMRGE